MLQVQREGGLRRQLDTYRQGQQRSLCVGHLPTDYVFVSAAVPGITASKRLSGAAEGAEQGGAHWAPLTPISMDEPHSSFGECARGFRHVSKNKELACRAHERKYHFRTSSAPDF